MAPAWTTGRWPAGQGRSGLALAAPGLVAEGEDGRLDPVLQIKLGEDTSDVGLDGLRTYAEFTGDLAVALTGGDQVEHLPLTPREGVQRVRRRRSVHCLGEASKQPGAEPGRAGVLAPTATAPSNLRTTAERK